jgi:hypothetical protein
MAKGKVAVKKGSGSMILWIAAGVLALGMLGPGASHKIGELAAKGGSDAAKGAAGAAAGTAAGVCEPGSLNHFCALPIDPTGDAANLARARAARDAARTVPTTTPPARTPYPPANGAVRPLPSQTPALPAAGEGGGSVPEIGQASGGILGGLVKSIPEIGPALEGGLKAIGPAAAP